MTQLLLELSQLEVEPIEAQEMGADILQQGQNNSLETMTTAEGKIDVLAILTRGSGSSFACTHCNSCCSCCACDCSGHKCHVR